MQGFLQQLVQEFKSGKSLQQLAAEKGLSLDQIKESIINAAKTRLDQAVAEGKISQDRANQIIERLQQLDLTKFPTGQSKIPGIRLHNSGK